MTAAETTAEDIPMPATQAHHCPPAVAREARPRPDDIPLSEWSR
ncbi:hypothetical protein [Microbacterium thalli]|uniref:Uncharacterized protein n=1 Tax=Microbacterium thalli TaxID=3027921 RepID=A0ABT5SIN2_9MICO|nr:hypothetical protein [Microbacterium thalli]MDD7962041.1 hypothetical protein [Microbacterium thalli]